MPQADVQIEVMPIATRVTEQDLGGGAAVLALPEGMMWPSQSYNNLFKRDFYDRFIRDFLHDFGLTFRRRVLVMGTEGIGKSSFALYATWKALWMGKTVVYQHHSRPAWFTVLMPGSDVVRRSKTDPRELEDPNVVYIVDGMTPRDAKAFTLFVSWPNRDCVYEWTKSESSTWYFPTWTLKELELMRTHCYGGRSVPISAASALIDLTDEELRKRFDATGGIPRFIFDEVNWQKLPDAMDDAAFSIAAVFGIAHLDFSLFLLYRISNLAVHIFADRETFKIKSLDFATPHAEHRVYRYQDQFHGDIGTDF
jgi:hypothetical protein